MRHGLNGVPFTIRREPVGVVAAIIPWNSPLFMLMAKLRPRSPPRHQRKPPLEFYPLAEAVQAAGLPAGVLNTVAANRDVSEYLVRHSGIDKVSFTGSTVAGRKVGAICGAMISSV